MVYWHELPFIRLCIPFVAGIVIQQVADNLWPVIISGLLALTGCTLAFLSGDLMRQQQLRTLILIFCALCTGTFLRYSVTPDQAVIRLMEQRNGPFNLVIREAEQTSYGTKARVDEIHTGYSAILYIKDSISTLEPGDTILSKSSLSRFSPAASPYAFDVATYYAHQGIPLRGFVQQGDIIGYRPCRTFSLKRFADNIRHSVLDIYRTYVKGPDSRGVLAAMTIGIREELTENLRDAYAKAGAIHILAISGLHVGVISFLLFALIGRVRASDRRGRKIIKVMTLLGGIWLFTLIAGLSPSATRAAAMFSIYLTGIMLRRPVKALNVLACTACVVLAVNPFLVNSVSFQFSYLALAGIAIFFRPLYGLIAVRTAFSKFVWGTIAVSIAAQFMLIPFMIYYFHQVSLISLAASLIAIPAAYTVLCGGLILLLLHVIAPTGAIFLGTMLDAGIALLNTTMHAISNLPLSYLTDLYLPGPQVALLAGISLCVAIRMLTGQRAWTFVACIIAITFSALHVVRQYRIHQQAYVAIHPKRNSFAIDYISGGTCFTTCELSSMSSYEADEARLFRMQAGVRQTIPFITDSMTRTQHIQIVELPENAYHQSSRHTRIALVSDTATPSLNRVLDSIQPDWVVLSGDLQRSLRAEIQTYCLSSHVRLHDLSTQGSFYLTCHINHHSHESLWENLSG